MTVVDPYSYPLTRRLVRPVLCVVACVVIAVVGGVAWYGSRLWLAVPLGMIAFLASLIVTPLFFRVGDLDDLVIDDWGWLLAFSAVLVNMAAMCVPVVWYDHVT